MKKGSHKIALLIWFMHNTGQYGVGIFEFFKKNKEWYKGDLKKFQSKSCFPFSSKLFSSFGKSLVAKNQWLPPERFILLYNIS